MRGASGPDPHKSFRATVCYFEIEVRQRGGLHRNVLGSINKDRKFHIQGYVGMCRDMWNLRFRKQGLGFPQCRGPS